jgi:ion channel-forming bestrophin family protein
MHIGKSYRPLEFLHWTRRKAYLLAASATLVAGLYQVGGWHWIAIPWPVLAMLGTAASFIVGFKNAQTYQRTMEAQQVWSSITAASRYWGLICRDFPGTGDTVTGLVNRHLAWLTALRYQLRTPRVWESAARASNAEYREKLFRVPEHDVALDVALAKYLPAETVAELMSAPSAPLALISMQSRAIRESFVRQEIPVLHHTEMQKTLKDMIDQHARAERLKNFPYPRQYAFINVLFVWTFALLLPLGVVKEFAQLNVAGFMQGQMGWLAVPFSVLVGWMYVALDQVGESTENPFEGSANDVPITHMCRGIELEMRTMLGERGLEALPEPGNQILL